MAFHTAKAIFAAATSVAITWDQDLVPPYRFFTSGPIAASGGTPPSFELHSVTDSGLTVKTGASFTGEVHVTAVEIPDTGE